MGLVRRKLFWRVACESVIEQLLKQSARRCSDELDDGEVSVFHEGLDITLIDWLVDWLTD